MSRVPPRMDGVGRRGARVESIPLAGRPQAHMGLAVWQADGTGPEAAAVGHVFETPLGRITAHYYAASRDHGGIDPRSPGGLAVAGPLRGFERFAAALERHGFAASDLILRFPLTTPTGAVRGVDWDFVDGVECRRLRAQGPIRAELRGEGLFELAGGPFTLRERYRDAASFADVRISLAAEGLRAVDASGGSSPGVRAAAGAFLDRAAGAAMRLVLDPIVLLDEGFSGEGRVAGRFAAVPGAWLETGG